MKPKHKIVYGIYSNPGVKNGYTWKVWDAANPGKTLDQGTVAGNRSSAKRAAEEATLKFMHLEGGEAEDQAPGTRG